MQPSLGEINGLRANLWEWRARAHGQPFKRVMMLRINVLLESGDASQESFERHISRVRHAVSRVNEHVPSRPFTKHLGVSIVA
jgi:hypothetical protein